MPPVILERSATAHNELWAACLDSSSFANSFLLAFAKVERLLRKAA
jgi:hypothetical protein